MLVVAGICLIWKLMEFTNDHSPDACIIPTPFWNKTFITEVTAIFLCAFKMISTNFLREKYMTKMNTK